MIKESKECNHGMNFGTFVFSKEKHFVELGAQENGSKLPLNNKNRCYSKICRNTFGKKGREIEQHVRFLPDYLDQFIDVFPELCYYNKSCALNCHEKHCSLCKGCLSEGTESKVVWHWTQSSKFQKIFHLVFFTILGHFG